MPIYHYTSAKALHSILESKSLRLTHYKYLNDETEFIEGLKLATELFKGVLHEISNQDDEEAVEHLVRMLEVTESFGQQIDESNDLGEIFIASFSGNGDLLSQWRAYGCYSIEFDEKSLLEYLPCSSSSILDYHKATMGKCAYTLTQKKDKLAEFLKYLIDLKEKNKEKVESELSEKRKESVKDFTLEFMLRLLITACYFKNRGFQEESEVRIVADSGPVKFEPKGNLIVPFTDFVFGPESIKSITVGPQKDQQLAIKSLATLIKYLNKKSTESQYDFEIKRSAIPFRDL